MTDTLQNILGELYAIDPTLRTHEQELLPIIQKMIDMKPDAKPDAAFVERLRITLREGAHDMIEGRARRTPLQSFHFLSSFFMNNPLQYTFAGLFVGVLVAVPLTYSLVQSGNSPLSPSDSSKNLFSYSVEETSSNAFGDLSVSNTPTTGNMVAGEGTPPTSPVPSAAMAVRPQSGGGGPTTDAAKMDARMMINPELTQYHLSFDGSFPALPDTVDVFKKIHNSSSTDFSKIMSAFGGGLIDLSSFKNARTDSITFYQDTPYGLMGTISLRDGTVSLNQNWETWPHPENSCQDEACFSRYRTKISDVPSDETVLSIAAAFVKDHGIDLAQYGAPEVDHQWKIEYDAMTDKNNAYVPDTIRVIYPLTVEGKPVYDENGGKSGISIGVNIRAQKVSDAWGITDQQYRKSGYTAATSAAVQTYLGRYGQFFADDMPTGSKVKDVDVTLGTPEFALVRTNHYHDNVNDELLVPALVFPVTKVSGGASFYMTSITVPLAADLLKERMNDGSGGAPVPMPLMQEGVR